MMLAEAQDRRRTPGQWDVFADVVTLRRACVVSGMWVDIWACREGESRGRRGRDQGRGNGVACAVCAGHRARQGHVVRRLWAYPPSGQSAGGKDRRSRPRKQFEGSALPVLFLQSLTSQSVNAAPGEYARMQMWKTGPTARRVLVSPLSADATDLFESRGSAYVSKHLPLQVVRALRDQYAREGEVFQADVDGLKYIFLVQAVYVRSGSVTREWVCPAFVDVNTDVEVIRLDSISGGVGETSEERNVPSSTGIGIDRIGGLETQLAQVRETVAMAFSHSSVYSDMGIFAPRGILLRGPPGTGKTLLARVIANEMGVSTFKVVNGPEIISQFQGESEENLAKVFEDALGHPPALIFLDEVDAIAEASDHAGGVQVEQRICATLASLMDKLEPGCQVFVLAATNRPDAIDESLRRPGRFDVEVTVPIPSEQHREQILNIFLKDIPHSFGENEARKLSQAMHGYVGADVESLCKEACLLNFARNRERIMGGEDVLVSLSDFWDALKVVRPSAIKEVAVQVPNVRWSDIGGNEDAIQSLREAVDWPLSHPEAFERMGIRPPRGILLFGPPGCSKTMMAKALATEAGLNFLAVKGPELFSKWVGESEKAVREVFHKARAVAPAIIFFDEIDALAVKRSSGDQGSGVADRVLSQLLSEMDGINPLQKVVVVAATNRPDMLDSALLRPGRLDRKLYIAPPDEKSREAILRIGLRNVPHCPESVEWNKLVSLTKGCSGAEVANICSEAALRTLRQNMDAKVVPFENILEVARNTTRSITSDMIAFYESEARKYKV
eukprot:CAMPEP_0119130138 /NCGR_PEP_ID=MMETSP1310-20130426/7593_1 /TAXON_ID=464262 /ORGANISM="Genus nov. species nov., Strain RCC2339" /LENGTH=786 /DNA_ID=CAMNT_0007120617 /DNA_START=70 /DNA_END=2430 /DNA_ORIENTATION=+